MQGVGQYLRRRQHVIEQPDLAKIVVLRQMKSEKIILQRFGGELQKLDLALRAEAGAAIVDLLDRQPRARQQRRRIECRPRLRRAETRRAIPPVALGIEWNRINPEARTR